MTEVFIAIASCLALVAFGCMLGVGWFIWAINNH